MTTNNTPGLYLDSGEFVPAAELAAKPALQRFRALDFIKTEEDLDAYVAEHVRLAMIHDRAPPFQQRVQPWMMECFGAEISADTVERNHRFLEESLELVQSLGCTASEAHQLVDYVYGRPVGDPEQETGGVMVTLAALCLAAGLDMHSAGEVELARINAPEMVAKIRAKQASKPRHSPLPAAVQPSAGFTDRQLESASMVLAQRMDYPWDLMPEQGRGEMRKHAKAILEAVHNA